MGTETRSTSALKNQAKKNDPQAICELGVRHLTGLFGCQADPSKAWELLDSASGLGDERAARIIEGAERPSEGDNGAEIMCNIAKMYADSSLDLDQYPDRKQDSLRDKGLAEYWYTKAANAESVRAIYELGEMYYMFGDRDYEKAAVLYAYVSGIEGEYADRALERLFNMLDRHIMRESWNCYPDVLFVLSEYTDHDVSALKELLDPQAELDNVTAESLLPEDIPYPLEVEEDEVRFGAKRSVRTVLLSMGVKQTLLPNGSCRIPYTAANRSVAERMCELGYNVTETKTGFTIREKKRRSGLHFPVGIYCEYADWHILA